MKTSDYGKLFSRTTLLTNIKLLIELIKDKRVYTYVSFDTGGSSISTSSTALMESYSPSERESIYSASQSSGGENTSKKEEYAENCRKIDSMMFGILDNIYMAGYSEEELLNEVRSATKFKIAVGNDDFMELLNNYKESKLNTEGMTR